MSSGFTTSATSNEIELKTFRDFLMQYNLLTEQCFNSCVTDFTRRQISQKEEDCSRNCLEKFLKMSQRLAIRFQEHQAIIMGGGEQQGKGGSEGTSPLIK